MGIRQFDQPRTIAVKRNGRWQLAGAEVSLSDNRIVLQTDRASWVRITWQACFSAYARVLGDAWERSYADLRWKPVFEPAFHPWYFAVLDDDLAEDCGRIYQIIRCVFTGVNDNYADAELYLGKKSRCNEKSCHLA